MTVGDKIKILRNEKGWIQQELADAIGVSVRTIKNYELGDSYPKNRLIYKKLADVFHVDINDLLMEDELFAMPDKRDVAYDDYYVLKQTLAGVKRIFRSGRIDGEDKDAFIRKVWDLYWDDRKRRGE